jgi:hypothetical protein
VAQTQLQALICRGQEEACCGRRTQSDEQREQQSHSASNAGSENQHLSSAVQCTEFAPIKGTKASDASAEESNFQLRLFLEISLRNFLAARREFSFHFLFLASSSFPCPSSHICNE